VFRNFEYEVCKVGIDVKIILSFYRTQIRTAHNEQETGGPRTASLLSKLISRPFLSTLAEWGFNFLEPQVF
jgi:hypothetical protein